MSLDVTIKQKGLFKKPLPLAVLLGARLQYGGYDDRMRLKEGELNDNGFVAFLPDAIARGIRVTWNAQEKDHVDLRLLTPTGRAEIRAFYAMVQRVMGCWHGELCVDGEKLPLERWMAGMDDFIDFNTRLLQGFQQLIDQKYKDLALDSAFWSVTVGKEEALRFINDPDAFEAWLHEKQSIDAFYASPAFFKIDGAAMGAYTLTEDCWSIFPTSPSVPYWVTDPNTQKQLVCDDFRVSIVSVTYEKAMGLIDYNTFLQRLPAGKVSRYDGGHILIEPLNLSELQTLLAD